MSKNNKEQIQVPQHHRTQLFELLEAANERTLNANSKEANLGITKQSDQWVKHYQKWSEKLSV